MESIHAGRRAVPCEHTIGIILSTEFSLLPSARSDRLDYGFLPETHSRRALYDDVCSQDWGFADCSNYFRTAVFFLWISHGMARTGHARRGDLASARLLFNGASAGGSKWTITRDSSRRLCDARTCRTS